MVPAVQAAIVVGGLAYGSWADWRRREVTDLLWIGMALAGTALLLAILAPDGGRAVLLGVLVAALVLEHLVPWDAPLEALHPSLPGYVELAGYGIVLAVLLAAGVSYGVGPAGLPLEVIAVFVTVLLARALFEVGLLYGGADAKALMVAGLLLPLVTSPLIGVPASAALPLGVFPFSLTLLMNAALLAVAVPLALGARNAARGEFEFPRGFTGFRIDVDELPRRFVWLRDPTFNSSASQEEREVTTTEEDAALRTRQRDELRAQGLTRVWVTPQIPFVILLALGALAGVVAGNLVYDLFALV